jgi:hypothetical protein
MQGLFNIIILLQFLGLTHLAIVCLYVVISLALIFFAAFLAKKFKHNHFLWGGGVALSSVLLWVFMFNDTASWKEEVVLHDGTKIVVKRFQKHKGRHELGQPVPIGDHGITFTIPGSKESITWKDEYSQDVGGANFIMLALHIKNDTPYIVASPTACLEYNKWGRPNPPQVYFRFDGNTWQRIPLAELPAEFKNINLVINASAHEKELVKKGVASAEMIRKLNSSLEKDPGYNTILRTPLEKGRDGCFEMIPDGKGGWLGVDWFTSEPTYEACLEVCERKKILSTYCPCGNIFNSKKKGNNL